jgi:hypothetical protein
MSPDMSSISRNNQSSHIWRGSYNKSFTVGFSGPFLEDIDIVRGTAPGLESLFVPLKRAARKYIDNSGVSNIAFNPFPDCGKVLESMKPRTCEGPTRKKTLEGCRFCATRLTYRLSRE